MKSYDEIYSLANSGEFEHITDDELTLLRRGLLKSALGQLRAIDFASIVLAEEARRSSDSASDRAEKLSKMGVRLACVAVAVGVVQIAIALMPLCLKFYRSQ